MSKKAVQLDNGDWADATVIVDVAGNPVVNTVATMGYTAQVTVTRPANATPYTGGDVVGPALAALTFPDIGPANSCLSITDVDLRIDVAGIPAGMTSFKLHLYNVTPPSALADNAVWDLPAGDRASYLGYLDLGTPLGVGSTLFVQSGGAGAKAIHMGATTSLFGYLVTVGGYTPTSGAVKSIRLNAKGI